MLRKTMSKNQNKYFRLLADTGVFAIGNLLVKLIQYFLLPLYTAAMTTEAYGIGELLNNLTELLFPIVTLALYEAVFRFSIEKDVDNSALIYESCKLIAKIFIALAIAVGIIQYILQYEYIWLLFFSLLCYSFRMLFANFARGCGATKVFSISGVINAIGLATLSFIFVFHFRLGAKGYLFAVSGGHLLSLIYLLFAVNIPSILARRRADPQLLRTMLLYSIPLIANNIAWWLTSTSSRYIVLSSLGASIAGLYTAANKLPAVISAVSQVFQQAWQLNSAREYNSEEREQFYSNVLRIYFYIVFFCTSVAICMSPILADITLKKDFSEARIYISPMMLSVGTHCLSAYFGSLLLALKQSRQAMLGMLLGASINVIFSIILIIPFGIWGVLFASFLCYFTILIHRIFSTKMYLKLNLNIKVNLPIYFFLCLQAILMSTENHLCIFLSLFLLAVIMFIIFFSLKKDIIKYYKRINR